MSKHRKTWRTSVALAAVAVVATVAELACSSSSSSNTVTLVVWTSNNREDAATKAIDSDFLKSHPNLKIEHVLQPLQSYFTLLRSRIAVRSGPDIVRLYASPITFDYYSGLYPLKSFVTDADRKDIDGWQYVSAQDGTPYAVPTTAQGIVVYYNKSLFTKAGIDPAQPPVSWGDLKRDCAALKAANITPIAAGFKEGSYGNWWFEVLQKQFVDLGRVIPFALNPNWKDSSVTSGLQRINELRDAGCFTPDAASIPLFPDTVDSFSSGRAAMFLGLASNTINWSQFRGTPVGAGDNLGVFMPPLIQGIPQLDYGPGGAYAITKWTKHPNEAWAYLHYWVSPNAQSSFFSSIGAFPVNRRASIKTNDPVAMQINTWRNEYPNTLGVEALERAMPNQTFLRLYPLVYSGSMTIEQFEDAVQAAQAATPPIPSS